MASQANRKVKIIGLTSKSNLAFVQKLNTYDQIAIYEEVEKDLSN
jgi:hypothetical protein